MTTISAEEAGNLFPDLLARVERGEKVHIVDGGKTVAVLRPLTEEERELFAAPIRVPISCPTND